MAYVFSKPFPLSGMKQVVIIAPHPDDEILGCASLIQKAIAENQKVAVVVLTGGEEALPEAFIRKEKLAAERRKLSLNAIQIVGMTSDDIYFLDWGDSKIHKTNDLTELDDIINDFQPSVIYVPHPLEGWSDHVYTAKLVRQLLHSKHQEIGLGYYCIWLWYSASYSKLRLLNWRKSFVLAMGKKAYSKKLEAMDAYFEPLTSFGKPYSGDLPGLFIKANKWKKELFFQEEQV
jgi:LmbE family N-acetylglucosaminyl deacetylase